MAKDISFDGVKVFSATMGPDRAALGEKITDWLAQHPRVRVVDKEIMQSSDDGFHCLSIVIFYVEK
jgi:folate-dependent tRNA-U54 methylase TrmFO/GidA